MTSPTPDDEIIREFSTVARRLSQAISQGRVTAMRRSSPRRSAHENLRRVPEPSRAAILAAVKWAMADADRARHPDRAREADQHLNNNGYTLNGPSNPHPRAREMEDELRATIADRTAQLAAQRREQDTPVATDQTPSRPLREELGSDTTLTPPVAGAVMAGAMIAAAIDEEAAQSLDDIEAAPTEATNAELATDRTVSIDDLLADAHPIPLAEKLSQPAELTTDPAAAPPQVEVGADLGVEQDTDVAV